MEYSNKFNKKINGFTQKSAKILSAYHYPGNVRELSNIVEYAVNFCDRDIIGSKHLPAYLTEQDILRPVIGSNQTMHELAVPVEYRSAQNWDDAERQMIIEALIKCGGRKGEAARILGWSRSTFWRKMNKHSISG